MRQLHVSAKFRVDSRLTVLRIFSVITVWGLVAGNVLSAVQKPDSANQASIETVGLSEVEIADGWLALFDGETTFGWSAASKANWTVRDGEVHVSEGERGLLRTTTQFDDFDLKLEFKISETTNSGIFVRTSPKPSDPAGDCFEINLAGPGQSQFTTGSLVNRKRAESVSEGVDDWFENWHRCRIVADGARMQIWIDDVQTMNYQDPAGEACIGRGFIALQLNSGPASFRKIRLKPLNIDPIFNGSDLSGWKTDQKRDSEFKVTQSGELNILSGRGQIETEQTFGDFVFSTQCKTNAVGLNSGVFYRCIPGEMMNGYESQIQNQFRDDDQSSPVDCGTGGIFRRVNARRVNANDKEWFCKTIIATGPHVSVWVNGYQVTDWSDRRKADPNPRRGRRLEAGTIIFQGHDPTTDILLKDIKARELKSRNR